MNMTALIIQLLSGLAGGNAAGAALKNMNLGPVGNSIAGLIGGGLGGQLLTMLMSSAAAGSGGLDLGSIVGNVAGGGVGGTILTLIVGFIKSKMAKS